MKAQVFARIAFLLSLLSGVWLFTVMYVCEPEADARLYGILSLIVALMVGVYKYRGNTIMPPNASLTRTALERKMAIAALALPPVMAGFSALSIVYLHAPVGKVGWTLFICAARCGVSYAEACRHAED